MRKEDKLTILRAFEMHKGLKERLPDLQAQLELSAITGLKREFINVYLDYILQL